VLSKILIKIARLLGLNYLFNFIGRHSFVLYSILLIVTNLIPVYGVFFLDWTTYEIIFLYWLENGIIGFFNIIKMYYAKGETKYSNSLVRPYMKYSTNPNVVKYLHHEEKKGEYLIPFFLVHYGGFFIIHGAFLFLGFGNKMSFFMDRDVTSLIVFLTSLVSVYIFSLVFDYFGKKQYEFVTKKSLFWSPYLRVVAIHLIIMLGYGFVGEKKLIVFFVIFKIVADLLLYGKDIPKQPLEESTHVDGQPV
jgi:hypothetical protein